MLFASSGEIEEVMAISPEHHGALAVLVECRETFSKQSNSSACCTTQHSPVRSISDAMCEGVAVRAGAGEQLQGAESLLPAPLGRLLHSCLPWSQGTAL